MLVPVPETRIDGDVPGAWRERFGATPCKRRCRVVIFAGCRMVVVQDRVGRERTPNSSALMAGGISDKRAVDRRAAVKSGSALVGGVAYQQRVGQIGLERTAAKDGPIAVEQAA